MRELLYAVLIVLVIVPSAVAQTSADFRQRFGKPLESYELKSNILMTVDYDEAGNVSVLTLERKQALRMSHPGESSFSSFSIMSDKDADVLLEEIVPVSVRGKRIHLISFSSSCNGVHTEVFQYLSIIKAAGCSSAGDGGLISVQVRWKQR